MEKPNPTRRDWFRLRLPRENRMLGESGNSAHHGQALQPIAHPPNHDGMDMSQLPPMREALLDEGQIAHLFSDIESLASEVQLMQRKRGSDRATAATANSSDQLEFAKNALLSGTVPRVQIRYRWQEALWIDTLTGGETGFKLIRIRHQSM